MLPKEFSEAATRLSGDYLAQKPAPQIIADGRLETGEQVRVYKGKAESGPREGMAHFLVVLALHSHAGGEPLSELVFSGSRDVRHPSYTQDKGRSGWNIHSRVAGYIRFPSDQVVAATAPDQTAPVFIERQKLLPPLEVIEGEGLPATQPTNLPPSPDSEQLRAVQ